MAGHTTVCDRTHYAAGHTSGHSRRTLARQDTTRQDIQAGHFSCNRHWHDIQTCWQDIPAGRHFSGQYMSCRYVLRRGFSYVLRVCLSGMSCGAVFRMSCGYVLQVCRAVLFFVCLADMSIGYVLQCTFLYVLRICRRCMSCRTIFCMSCVKCLYVLRLCVTCMSCEYV